jgi:small subunit ribosomal protein S7
MENRMPRRKIIQRKATQGDPKHGSDVVAKFITRMMYKGKKSTAQNILYDSMATIQEKAKKDGLEVFLKAIENVKPMVEVKSRRVGGSTYQVPVEVRDSRREALAMRWIIQFARQRPGKSFGEKLSAELLDAFNETGSAFKKKEDTHRMAEANKAFAHYRW